MRYVVIAVFALLLVAASLALGVAFAPSPGEANCHQLFRPPQIEDRGTPWNPIECRTDAFGVTRCSSRY